MQPACHVTVQLQLSTQPQALTGDDRRVKLAARDALLLAWLALEGPTPRNRLAALLWPDSGIDAARNALRQRLFVLRRQFGDEALVVGNATLALADGVTHDLEAADDVLPDVPTPVGEELAAWLAQQRERRRSRWRRSLVELADDAERAGDLDDALSHAEELLALEPLSEPAHRRLMRVHYLRGDRAAALLAFDRCEQALKHDVGAAPAPDTLALLHSIERCAVPDVKRPRPALPASVARPPRLIGREPELLRLAQARQAGQVALVIGEAGMGKSRLLHTVAQQHGRSVLCGARPGDAGVPFATLSRLLREVLRHAPQALQQVPRDEIARVLPEIGEPLRQGEAQQAVLERALLDLLGASAAVLDAVLVDDVHFADTASLEMLQSLIGSTAGAGLGWVLAMRPAEAGSARQGLADRLLDAGQLTPVVLGPLDVRSLQELVGSLDLPGLDAEALAPMLLQHTGGNPMFVLETLKRLWVQEPQAADAARLPRPASVGLLIDRRLTHLSADALALTRLAAIAGADFGVELAETVLGQPAIGLASAWQELEAAHVFRGGGFAHDLVYEAALRSVPQGIACHTHRAVAQWLQAHGGEPARVAEHWLSARQEAQAVPHLVAAARRSEERARQLEARRFLERAASLCTRIGDRALEFDVLRTLAHNYTRDDPGAAHDALVERLQAIAVGPTQVLWASVAAHELRRRRQQPDDLDALARDSESARRLGDHALRCEMLTRLVAALAQSGRTDEALEHVPELQALNDQAGEDRRSWSDFHGNLSVSLANHDRFAPAFEHSLRAEALFVESGEMGECMTVLSNRLRILRTQGRIDAALELLRRMDLLHAASAPNPRSWWISRVGAADVLRDAGRFAEALQALQVEPEKTALHAGRLWPAWPLSAAQLWLQLGQHARARQALAPLSPAQVDAAPDWLRARLRLVAAQVGARSRGGGGAEQPGPAELALLEQAVALAPRGHRRAAWIECELQRAAWIPPAEGAALAESLAQVALEHQMPGYAQGALVQAAACRHGAGETQAARDLLDRARALSRQRFTPADALEAVVPHACSPARMALTVWQVAQDGPRAGAAAAALRQAAHELRLTASQQVPAPFRESFLQRHPVHRELLAAAARSQ